MATAKRVFNQIEINFWNVAIPMLKDTSEIHPFMRSFGGLISRYRKLPLLMRWAIWGSAGWFFGLALGAISGFLIQ